MSNILDAILNGVPLHEIKIKRPTQRLTISDKVLLQKTCRQPVIYKAMTLQGISVMERDSIYPSHRYSTVKR